MPSRGVKRGRAVCRPGGRTDDAFAVKMPEQQWACVKCPGKQRRETDKERERGRKRLTVPWKDRPFVMAPSPLVSIQCWKMAQPAKIKPFDI